MEDKNTDLTKIVIGGRATGKTIAMIKEAASTGAVIVAASESHKKNILATAAVMGLEIKTPLTVSELRARRGLNKKREPFRDNIIIDDLDIWAQRMITSYLFGEDQPNVSITAVSLNDRGNFLLRPNWNED